jgi:LacI family transcriptional regulator
VLSALASAGRRVPADVAVVSCDDMPFAEYLIPSLSSLRVPFAETGQEAVELLLRSIAGEQAPQSTVRLPVELIVRDSCGGRPAPAAPVAFRPVIPAPSASPAQREKQKEDS